MPFLQLMRTTPLRESLGGHLRYSFSKTCSSLFVTTAGVKFKGKDFWMSFVLQPINVFVDPETKAIGIVKDNLGQFMIRKNETKYGLHTKTLTPILGESAIGYMIVEHSDFDLHMVPMKGAGND